MTAQMAAYPNCLAPHHPPFPRLRRWEFGHRRQHVHLGLTGARWAKCHKRSLGVWEFISNRSRDPSLVSYWWDGIRSAYCRVVVATSGVLWSLQSSVSVLRFSSHGNEDRIFDKNTHRCCRGFGIWFNPKHCLEEASVECSPKSLTWVTQGNDRHDHQFSIWEISLPQIDSNCL